MTNVPFSQNLFGQRRDDVSEDRLRRLESQQNDLAQGTLGYAQVTASQGSITALVDLTSLTVTLTVVATRRIKVVGDVQFSSSVAADNAALFIYEGATGLQSRSIPIPSTGINYLCRAEVILTPGAGSHTYKLSTQRNGGTGNITMAASATAPAFIHVEDLGAA